MNDKRKTALKRLSSKELLERLKTNVRLSDDDLYTFGYVKSAIDVQNTEYNEYRELLEDLLEELETRL